MSTPGSTPGYDAKGRAGRQWVALKPATSYKTRLFVPLAAGAGWVLLALLVGGVRLLSPENRSAGGIVLLIALLLAGVIPLWFAFRAWLVYRHLDDAKVLVDHKDLALGSQFNIRVEQRARHGLQISEMRVGLICTETLKQTAGGKDKTRTVPLMEKWETCTRDKRIDHAKRLSATRAFRIPPTQRASSPIDQKDPPIVQWKLRVVTAAAGAPPYDVDFPVRVHATPSVDDWGDVDEESVPERKRG